ncbi:hypothetical protein ACQPYK_32595 [Streptosporangium sp. CA-135522]|uniref:hypothetical protein n=1 Tax=Streptosporangium sp. CA-135522 TaxID=3240072 RepID=UPI003D946B44
MSVQWRVQGKPRVAAWLALLVGTLTVIHLWSHAAIPYKDRACRIVSAAAADSHPSSQDHHCEQAHAAECVPPSVWSPPPPQDRGVLAHAATVTVVPAPPVPARLGRAPPAGYRARSVLTHTLEICRC